MSFKILNDNTIQLTRGDTAAMVVDIFDSATSATYIMEPDDTLTLSVKKSTSDRNCYIQKVVEGVNRIVIDPEDTSRLGFGTYIYDVQLEKATGAVATIIDPATFELLPEVTW